MKSINDLVGNVFQSKLSRFQFEVTQILATPTATQPDSFRFGWTAYGASVAPPMQVTGYTPSSSLVEFNAFYDLVSSGIVVGLNLAKDLAKMAEPACSHSWKHYQGFTDSYDYCEHCNEKRT